MITADEARALALALPGAEANSHFDTPDFRVNGKIFATLPGPDRMIVRMEPPDQAVLLAAEPATFSPCPGTWGLKGWTIVQLGSVDPDVMHDLLIDAWRLLVGKRAAAAFEAERSGQAGPGRRAGDATTHGRRPNQGRAERSGQSSP